MKREEVNIAIDWAAKEGWNPGFHDADCYYHTDPNGFFMGLLDGKPISTLSVVKYSASFGFLGFYIVHPDYRRQGYGLKIWKSGIQYLYGCNIGLDGVVEQQTNYKKFGFKLAYRNIRFECLGSDDLSVDADVIKLAKLPFETIELYACPFFPEKRIAFMKAWLNQPDCKALGIIQNDSLVGYGVMRKALNGYKVGPLYADTLAFADAIFSSLIQSVDPLQPVYLDIPEVNQEALKLAERYKMKKVFETARMYTGKFPDLPLDKLYGVTSFEVG
ncbi:GNAT family N-acetyltransferase [Zooshikella sp. WH53]|uniref:GNAT family N-acetyltransferase n=2 Tax=Zooshikella harenae TaxID=2827238 RepID=A0ABS5Z6V9_9GAMM|nr:GNAT family N-acetyltransferase [Zooshikella harenae]